MKISGFVSELNPLTYGHKYLIDKIKEDKPDVIITSMSPNFVMRGEPAIFDKFKRTKWAIENGVDLVIEIPTFYSIQSSDKYARKGIELLIDSGCTDIYFGVEEFDTDKLYKIVEIRKQDKYKELLKKNLDSGLSFNQSSKKAIIDIDSSLADTLNLPNNMLAIEYINTILESDKKINIHMIKRIDTGYFDDINKNTLIQSASSIREIIKNNDESIYLPYDIKGIKKHYLKDYYSLIKYRIDSSNANDLKDVLNISEGIENLIKSIKDKDDIEIFINSLISKRNRETKIKRILISILLNIKKDEIDDYNYIRVLGFNSIGKTYLNNIKDNIVITQIKKNLPKGIYREIDFTKIYDDSLIDFEYKPIIL